MKSKLLAAALTAGLSIVGWSQSAHAGLVTCEPDDFAAGTVLTNACTGVTLSVETTDATFQPVSAAANANASTGPNIFVNANFTSWRADNNNSLRVDFAQETDFVSIDIIADDNSDEGFLRVFNSSDVQIGEFLTGPIVGTGAFVNASLSVSGIAYALASGLGIEAVQLDNLQYNVPMPEPGALAILGLGLAGLAYARRRKAA